MNTLKSIAVALIIAGGLGLIYGGFSYNKQTHETNIGPLHLEVVEQERVNIPLWAGLATVAAGVALLLVASRK